jgi:hypothetical protein
MSTMTKEQFGKEFQALVRKSGLMICQITDECLIHLGRMNIEDFGQFRLGIEHLNGHFLGVAEQLQKEAYQKTLH